MPHKPNPIPRFHGNSTTKSNRQIQDRIPPGTPDSSSQSLHQSDNTLLQRHRTDSWASQSSAGHDTAARTSMPSAPSSSGHTKPSSGGGRAGGRALPPPRFQRKQRPPRVQQAIAAANAASAASGPSGATTSRRVAPPAPTGPLGVGGGTLTLGPANNWGAGTTSVTSLPMSAINAASARGSVIHRYQSRPTPNQYPTTTTTNMEALDRGGPFVLEGGLQPDTRLLLDGLDPVQLHNRLTMGNPAGSNETGFIPAYTQYLPEMSYGHADIQTSPAKNLGTSHATRPRSQSHNVAQPVGAFNAPLTHLPTSIASSQAYGGGPGLGPGLEQNSGLHSADLQPYQNVQQHLRNRSRSLITEIQISNMISGLPPVHSMPHSAGAEGFSDLVHSPGQFTAPSYSAAEQPTPPPAKRPLKSALKVRKSAPEFIDTSLAWHDADAHLPLPHGSNASSSSFNASSSSLDTGSLGSSFAGLHQAASHSQLSLLPDPHFSLPDSLQAQYAHQLRLLQEEYSQKAAKAERLRQRVAQRQSGMKGNVHQINTVLANIQIHDNPSHELLHVSPPSSGGGSGSGHRVSFDDGVEVIGMSTMDPSAYHDGSGVTGSEGYASWDEEWEEPVEAAPHEDDTFDYAYADGFGNGWMDDSNGTAWPTEDTRVQTLRPLEEEDGRSDVGEGGHDVSPSRMQAEDFDSMMSPVEPIMLSADNRDIDLEQVSIDAARNFAEELVPVIQVEVIAPTPPRTNLELDAAEHFEPQPSQPLSQEHSEQQVAQPVPSTEKEAQPPSSSSRSSTEEGSSASTDSNRTLKHQSESPSDSDPTTSASVKLSLSDKQNVTLPSAKLPSDRAPILESPTVHIPQPTRTIPPSEPIPGEPIFPPPLQRLAQRVSRGTASGLPPPLPPPNEPLPNVAFPNTQTHNLSSPDLRLQQVGRVEDLVNHSMNMRQRIPSDPIPPANYLPTGDIYDRTLRRSRGMSNAVPIPSFDPDPLYASNAQMENSSIHQMDHASILPDLYAFPQQELQNFPPFAPGRRGTSRRHNLAIADISSATSVESGSSHGGGTSGGSHSHRSFKRSNAGSIMSHSSSSGLDLPHRSVPHPAISNSIPLERTMARPPPNNASLEGQEILTNQTLSNAISMESLRPVSISSGKSAGSSGSGKPVSKSLGGDSIWTLGKEEEAGWPSVSPTFNGQSSRGNPQYTLQSLLPTSLGTEIEQTEHVAHAVRAGDGRFRAPNPSSLSLPGVINRQPLAQHPLRTAESFIPLHSNSSPTFHSNEEEEYQDEILNDDVWLQDYNRLRAMRAAEVQAQIAPFAPPWNTNNYTSLQGQQSTRSLPILYNGNINSNERLPQPQPQPHPFNQPVPSSQSFEREIPSRKGVVALPATGGVFPRYQEVGDVYVDLTKPGGNTGRFKSFFRSRDSRQFK